MDNEGLSYQEAVGFLGLEGVSTRGTAKYMTYYQTLDVSDYYKPKLVIYCEVNFNEPNYYTFTEILNVSMDRLYNGISKQFTGEIYYNVQSSSVLYYQVNGDFYNNGETEVGVSVGATNGVISMSASITSTSNHYQYYYKASTLTIYG